tara:strand:- start:130 stop:1005 length:876 start_codon:yes stop_codon:yes gene_type:complete
MKLNKQHLNQIIQEEYERMLAENGEYSKYRDQHNYPPAQLEDPNLDFGALAPGWVDDGDGPLPAGPEADVAHGDRVANEYETGAYADFNPAYGIPPGGIDSWERQPQVRDTIRGIGPQNDQGYSREAVRARAARSNVTALPGWGSSGHNVVPNLQEEYERMLQEALPVAAGLAASGAAALAKDYFDNEKAEYVADRRSDIETARRSKDPAYNPALRGDDYIPSHMAVADNQRRLRGDTGAGFVSPPALSPGRDLEGMQDPPVFRSEKFGMQKMEEDLARQIERYIYETLRG